MLTSAALDPHVSDPRTLAPAVSSKGDDDVMLMSAGPTCQTHSLVLTSAGTHMSEANHEGDVMLTSASHVDQPQRDTCQPRNNSAFFIFQK
jgi:hypothetical protein